MKKMKKEAQAAVLVLILLASMAGPASSLVSAAIGETVVLSGGGGGYDTMYLFLTGPNLAPGGVRLDSIMSPVVSGEPSTFTRASVDDGRWEYSWDTQSAGGSLDAGTYLVWATPVPLGRYGLAASGENYATIGVTVTRPTLTAGIATIPLGSLRVTSDPAGAEVSVNSVQYGTTPLVIEGLAGGPVGVSIVKEGYALYEEEIVIRTGTMAVMEVDLIPATVPTKTVLPTEIETTTPPPVPSPEPTSAPAPCCEVVAGTVLALTAAIMRNKREDK